MRLKLLLRYPVDIRRARRLLEAREARETREDATQALPERPLVLDLRTPQLMFDCGRHLQSIAYYAWRAGSPTRLRCSNLVLGGIARKVYGREMLAQPYVNRISATRPLPPASLVLGDYEPTETEAEAMSNQGITYLRMLIGRDIDRSVPNMPYPMYPNTLRYLADTDLNDLRNRDSHRTAILFAGCQKARYGDGWMQREFGVLSRLEILDTLREQYSSRVQESLPQSGCSRPIVLLDSRMHGIPAAQWLPTLADARFFLCCPGGRQPLCHNLIEAMSVGTIPIIEYGARITPSLRDGENAICFRGRRGLIEAVKRIDRMGAEELRSLSRRVSSFYDQHLCGTRFIRDMRDGKIDGSAGRLCMPFHERNFYAGKRAQAVWQGSGRFGQSVIARMWQGRERGFQGQPAQSQPARFGNLSPEQGSGTNRAQHPSGRFGYSCLPPVAPGSYTLVENARELSELEISLAGENVPVEWENGDCDTNSARFASLSAC